MNELQQTKFVPILSPGAKADNTSPATKAIDLAGYGFCQIYIMLGDLDIALTALKLQESDLLTDQNTLNGDVDVADCVFGTSKGADGQTSVLPSATSDNGVYRFDIDCRGRKRYIDPTITVGDGSTGAYVTAFALLSRPQKLPKTAAEAGCNEILRALA